MSAEFPVERRQKITRGRFFIGAALVIIGSMFFIRAVAGRAVFSIARASQDIVVVPRVEIPEMPEIPEIKINVPDIPRVPEVPEIRVNVPRVPRIVVPEIRVPRVAFIGRAFSNLAAAALVMVGAFIVLRKRQQAEPVVVRTGPDADPPPAV